MASRSRRSMSIDDEISMLLDRLRPVGEWDQYNGNHLACLAHLYVIGKSVVILALLRSGVADSIIVRYSAPMPISIQTARGMWIS